MDIYLDESGYTGDDLANTNQPVFVLAGIATTPEQAEAWKSQYFTGVVARELKHSELKSYPSQQRMVLELLRDIEVQSATRVSITHKRFALLARMIDYVLEPMMRADGIDLYENGANLALTNLLWLATNLHAGNGPLGPVLPLFQQFVRDRTPHNFRRFADEVMEMEVTIITPLNLLKLAVDRFGDAVLDGIDQKRALDVSFTAALSLTSKFSSATTESLALVHDESSNMSTQKDIWDAITSPDVPNALMGYDRRTIQYPLRVTTTKFSKSTESVALQIADVVAGAVAHYARWLINDCPPTDEYAATIADVIERSYLPNGHKVWPAQEFTPEELGTVGGDAADPNEFLGELASSTASARKSSS